MDDYTSPLREEETVRLGWLSCDVVGNLGIRAKGLGQTVSV